MKRSSIIGFILLLSVSLTFCGVKHEFQAEFPQEIKSVFYHKKLQSENKDSSYLQIEFKKPLLKSIALKKIYFRNQEGVVKEITPRQFKAYLTVSDSGEDFIMDRDSAKEYGNKAPVISKAKFDIQWNEAVLEYTKDHKTYFFKMTNIIERSLQ